MSDKRLKNVLSLLNSEKALEAKNIFQDIKPEENADYYFVLGKLEQKFQNWSSAINAYSRVLELNPDNNDAQNNLHIIKNIMNFWNPEMFNP